MVIGVIFLILGLVLGFLIGFLMYRKNDNSAQLVSDRERNAAEVIAEGLRRDISRKDRDRSGTGKK
jgi:uncharacterized membrane-anchored protein YhcB (DUF1043 family)